MVSRRMLGALSAASLTFLATAAASDTALYLSQGWDVNGRRLFYNDAQGSPIVPLAWFLALEQPGDGQRPLFRENHYLESFGLLPEAAHPRNPYALPVGLTVDRALVGGEQMLGMNCSACHVGRLEYGGQVVQIDGAPANFDFIAFMQALDAALSQTLAEDERLERFARRLGETVAAVRPRLRQVVREREDWAYRNTPTNPPGPGRVDALGVILNQVVAKIMGHPENARTPDAPVSYPYLWGAPYLTFVQYNGVAPNVGAGALARNVGQVLGVFGEVSLVSATLPPGYASSVSLGPLGDLEGELETLTSPRWSELAAKGVLPPIDSASAERGRTVFVAQCLACHGAMDGQKPGALASVPVTLHDVDRIGTDPSASHNFVSRTAVAGPLAGKPELFAAGEPICEEAFASDLLTHVTLGVLANEASTHVKQVGSSIVRGFRTQIADWLGFSGRSAQVVEAAGSAQVDQRGDFTSATDLGEGEAKAILESIASGEVRPHNETDGCGKTERPARYRARPLNGVWATGPFLHNGSVPTLAAMLTPAAERPATFYAGSRQFDPVALGFESGAAEGLFLFDTTLPGNSNAGHEFGVGLDDQAKRDLLEFLKTK